jgi:hypothetical protein
VERQHLVFIIAAGAAFALLIGVAYFNPFQQSEGEETDSNVVKARKGQEVYVRYSSSVVKLIQDLPNKNALDLEVSSELQVTNLAGLRGEMRYPDMEITYVQNGETETIDGDDFGTIEYRFFPDAGNMTKYSYDNVDFIAKADDSQVLVAIKPLSTAKIGEQYTIKMVLHTGGVVSYQINEKIIEIIP